MVIPSDINFKTDVFLIILMFKDSLFVILHFDDRFSEKFTCIVAYSLNVYIIRLA